MDMLFDGLVFMGILMLYVAGGMVAVVLLVMIIKPWEADEMPEEIPTITEEHKCSFCSAPAFLSVGKFHYCNDCFDLEVKA